MNEACPNLARSAAHDQVFRIHDPVWLPSSGPVGLAARGRSLPAAVHPPPLLGVAQDQPLEHRIVCARIAADFFVVVPALDRRERVLEAQDMPPVGLAPGRGRHNGCAGGARDNREAAKRACGITEEFDLDAIAPARVLIEREQDQIVRFQASDEQIEGASLGQRTEAEAAGSADEGEGDEDEDEDEGRPAAKPAGNGPKPGGGSSKKKKRR